MRKANVHEQEDEDRLDRLCHGRAKADRLQYIWNNSWPHGFHDLDPQYRSKEDDFRLQATLAGYSKLAIDLFLTM